MATIQVRKLDEETRNVLGRRAAAVGKSLQEYLLGLLTDIARQPTLDEVFARVAEHTGGRLDLDEATTLVQEDRGN